MEKPYVVKTPADKNMKRSILLAIYLSNSHLCQVLGPWHSSWQKHHVIWPLEPKPDKGTWQGLKLQDPILYTLTEGVKTENMHIILHKNGFYKLLLLDTVWPTCLLASSRLASGQIMTFLLHWTGSLPVSPATVTAICRFG